jgi:O-antigen/teichoic acid export membrane protein
VSVAARSLSVLNRDAVLTLTNLATGVVVARVLGPDTFGVWVILQLIPTYAEAFGRIKADTAAVYYMGRSQHTVADVVRALHTIALATSLLILIPVLIRLDWFAAQLFGPASPIVRWYMLLMMAQVPLLFVYMNYTYLFIQREDFRSYNRMVILRALVGSVLSVTLLLVFRLGLAGVAIGSTMGVVVSALYGAFRFDAGDRRTGLVNTRVVRDLSAYGVKLYAGGLMGHLNAYVAQAAVVLFLRPAQVAFFGMAQSQGALLSRLSDALGIVLYPRIARTTDSDAAAALGARGFRVVLTLLACAAAGAALVIHPAIVLLYGRAYTPVVAPFLIMLPGLMLSAASATLTQYFQGSGRADLLPKILIAPVCVQLAAAALLIPRFEVRGAALSFALAGATLGVVQVIVFLRVSKLRLSSVIPGASDASEVMQFVRSLHRDHFAPLWRRAAHGNQ